MGARILLALLLVVLHGEAGRAAGPAVRVQVSRYEVTDPARVAEIERAEAEHRKATEAAMEASIQRMRERDTAPDPALRRDIEAAFEEVERQSRQALADRPRAERRDPGSEADAEEARRLLADALEESLRLALEGGHGEARRLEARHQAALWNATRGLEPEIVRECVVAEGQEVGAEYARGRRRVTTWVVVDGVERDGARVAVWDAPTGSTTKGYRDPLPRRQPFGKPILVAKSASTGRSHTLDYLVLEPAGRSGRPQGCRVHYRGGSPPAARARDRTRPDGPASRGARHPAGGAGAVAAP